MIIRLILIFLILFLSGSVAFPQKYSRSNCYEKALLALEQLPVLYRENKRSQFDSLLNDWEFSCGRNEYTLRLRTLVRIADDKFISFDFDDSYYQSLISYLEDEKFKLLMDSVHENPRELYLSYYQIPDLHFAFTQFTQELARQLQASYSKQSPCSSERMLLNAYAGNLTEFFKQLRDPACQSVPSNYYHTQLNRIAKRGLIDASFYTGLWIPYGQNRLLGNHPLFGFSFGYGRKRMIYSMAFEFRFLKSKETYYVQFNGASTPSNHFFGGYIGLDLAYELNHSLRSKLYMLGGIAADGFDTIKANPDLDIKTQSIFVLNLNSGLGWRLFGRDGSYTGLEVRHNFVHYPNPGGTALNGNTVTIRLLVGVLKNDRRQREIDHLKILTGD